jgi:hypothetical protein
VWNCRRNKGKEPGSQCQTLGMCHKTAKAERGGRPTSQPPRGDAGGTQQRSGEAQRLREGAEWQNNLPKQGRRWITELISGTEGSMQNLIAPPCWGRSWPNSAAAEEQHSCCLLKTTALTTLHELVILLHLTTPTNLVDRRSNTTHKPVTWWDHISFCLNSITRIGHLRNNPRTFINRLNFLWFLKLVFFSVSVFIKFFSFFFFFINSIITIFLSLFSSSSLSLLLLHYNPLFSLPTTLSAPSHPLSPCLHLPLLPLATCYHMTPPSYIFITCWLAYYTTYTQPQPPAIPHKNTLHYNNRNTHKHTQEPQNPAAPMPHSPSTHSFSHPPPFSAIFNNFPNSISNLLTITPLNFHCL